MARDDTRIRRLLAECADEGLRESGDLWPRVQAQVLAGQRARRRVAFRMAAATLVVLAVLAAQAPAVRRAANGAVARVRLALAGREPAAPPQVTILKATEPAPPASPAVAPLMAPAGLEELRRRMPFPLRTPARLPAGLEPAGGQVIAGESGPQAVIEYRPAGEPAGAAPLRQWISAGALPSPPLPPVPARTPIDVNGRAAAWAHSEGALWLIWPEDGLNYALEARDPGLSLDDLVQMAAALE